MSYIYPILFCGTIATGVYFYKEILKFTFKCIDTPPGITSISKEGGKYYVKTNLGKLKLKHFRTPTPETNVYFFKQGHQMDIKENILISNKDFLNNYSEQELTKVFSYNFGIIPNVYYPQDFKKKDKLTGFIESVFDAKCYIFVYENNQMIDYMELFEKYSNAL